MLYFALISVSFILFTSAAVPIEYKCCATSSPCLQCTSFHTSPLCLTEQGCAEQCRGTFCNASSSAPTPSGSCGTDVDYGTFTYSDSYRIPYTMLAMPPTTLPARRLLADRYAIGICRTLPFPIGTITALCTPGYDDGGSAALAEELQRTNSQIASLSSTVGDLATKVALEAQLRLNATNVLADMVSSAVDDINRVRSAAMAGLQSNTVSIALNSVGILVSQQASLLLDRLNRNSQRMADPVTSPIVQKFLKLASLGTFDPSISIDINADSFSFLAYQLLYAWSDYQISSLLMNVTVTRRPTALSFLLPGDYYIYEVTYSDLAMFPVFPPSIPDCIPPYTNATAVALCMNSLLSTCYINGSCFFERAPPLHNVPQSNNTGFVPVSLSSCEPTPYPSIRYGPCCGPQCVAPYDNCANYSTNRVCDLRIDALGSRPTTIWLPTRFCSDPYHRCYPGSEFPSTSQVLYQNQYTNITTGNLYPTATQFFDPIYLAIEYHFKHVPRVFNYSRKFSELFESGNRQDNTAFASFGDIVDVPVGYLSGVTTPVVLDPAHFPNSFNMISWFQGSVPLAGWAPTDSCYVAGGHMCCRDFPFGPTTSSIQQQLGYIVDNVPVQYQPRTFYDQILSLQQSLLAIQDLNFTATVPPSLITSLSTIYNQTIQLEKDLHNITLVTAGITTEAQAANRRIASAQYDASIGVSAYTIAIIAVVGLALLLCLCALARGSPSVTPITRR